MTYFTRRALRPFVQAATCALLVFAAPQFAEAQQFRFDNVVIEGNERVAPETILAFAGISRGTPVSAARLNDAYQNVVNSGLFETVEIDPQGGTLVIRVDEYPTINQISIEGNRRLKDELLIELVQSEPRRAFNPIRAEADAAAITAAYREAGRLNAEVLPRIIERDGNRVDLVFEVSESRVTEVERLSFTGNRAFSDRRLRRVLATKQAGLFRTFIRSDTLIADRLDFDRQVLTDFYLSRGYIDFQVVNVSSEVARERDAVFITFDVSEGQQYRIGRVSTSSVIPGVDATEYQDAIRLRSGSIYSPTAIENSILRMERLALRQGIDFLRVEPRITRNRADQTVDVEFVLSRGPRVFVERIDINGNNTTLDRVIRRQFTAAEGDPFNPREVRASAERVRALGYFARADVDSRQGSSPDQVIIDVDVEEQPTGSLSFGASYGREGGLGFNLAFREENFLGRGQALAFEFTNTTLTRSLSFNFYEPALLGRDLGYGFGIVYGTTDGLNATYDTERLAISNAFDFPVGEYSDITLRYTIERSEISEIGETTSPIIRAEPSDVTTSSFGYLYEYDTRGRGLDPDAGVQFRFGQEFAGLGGDAEFIKTTALLKAERRVFRGDAIVRAEFEGGGVTGFGDYEPTLTDRFFTNSRQFRGFESRGIGPRETRDGFREDPLGGQYYAVARFETGFPLGLPEEYGITGGAFFDVGSVWGLPDTDGGEPGEVEDDFALRASAGLSIFADTPLGPLRFNFSRALQKEEYDRERNFDFLIQTNF